MTILTSPSTFAQGKYPELSDKVDFEDFWASHSLDCTRQGFRILDLHANGQFETKVHMYKLAPPLQVQRCKNLPEGFDQLVQEANADGHPFLIKMRDEWHSGKNSFDQAGEILFTIITEDGLLAAVGGLNIDPYAADPSIGRVRHVYVGCSYRGRGLGKTLLDNIIAHARGYFSVLRLRTHNPRAVNFYKSLGFAIEPQTDDPTHIHFTKNLLTKAE